MQDLLGYEKQQNMENAMRLKKKINIYLIFVILIIFGIFQYGINKIFGFTLVPDEFGYWSSAAKTVGYDWSAVASLGSYYSFGYSFILVPVLKLFQDGVAAYRAAITINVLLVYAAVFLMLGIIKKIFPETEETKRILVSGIAVLYPSWIFYMQMTMTEALLIFLFVLITYLFISLIQKAQMVTTLLLALSLIYIYCVHMRTVGVLIACVITLVLWMVLERPKLKTVLMFWGAMLLFGALAVWLKRSTIAEVFSNADAEVLNVNDYGGQWEKIRQILTIQGCLQFIKETAAKVFYLGLASFGIFYWGIGFTAKESFSLIKKSLKRKKGSLIEWTALFLLLSAVGEILISSIYMYQSKAIDGLIYGRYDEFVVPVFLLIGLIAMSKSRKLFQVTAVLGIASGMLVPIFLNMIKHRSMEGLRGYMVPGVSYLLKEDNLNVSLFFRNTWVLAFCVMFLTAFLVWLSRKKRSTVWILAGIMVIEIAAGLQISHHYIYPVNDSNFMDIRIAEEIENRIGSKGWVAYLDEDKPQYIDFIQMQLGERSIEIIPEEDVIVENGRMSWPEYDEGLFLITHFDTQYADELEELFNKCVKANTFYLYYND